MKTAGGASARHHDNHRVLRWLVLTLVLGIVVVAPILAIKLLPSPPTILPLPPTTVTVTNFHPTEPTCNNPCVIAIENSLFGSNNRYPIAIAKGTTVTWINEDNTTHTTTSNSGLWDSGVLQPNQNFSFTFNSPGTYYYHCKLHPMSSEIIVLSG
jgi:hypothetical protein